MATQEIKTSRPAGKDKEKWADFIVEEKQKTPARIENAAKAIGGIISITLTLLISLLQNRSEAVKLPNYKTVILLWLVSAILAFFVIFPFPYRYNSLSINSFIKSHNRTVIVKYSLLVISVLLYLAGMILLALDVW